jgi:hypothetical protein
MVRNEDNAEIYVQVFKYPWHRGFHYGCCLSGVELREDCQRRPLPNSVPVNLGEKLEQKEKRMIVTSIICE